MRINIFRANIVQCLVLLVVSSIQPFINAMDTVIEFHAIGGITADSIGPGYCVDVSADGSVVLGSTIFVPWFNTGEAFIWENGEITWLEGIRIEVYSISSNGKVVVGSTYESTVEPHAMYWRNGTAYLLPELPGTVSSMATVVSSDGSIIGGINYLESDSGIIPQTVIWKNAEVTALAGLSILPLGMSGDGNLVGGANGDLTEPWSGGGFVYSISDGKIYGLDDGGASWTVPWDISMDGTTVVGIASGFKHFGSDGAYFGGAQWWNLNTGVFIAPETTEWGDTYAAESVSGDGSVVIASLISGQEFDDLIIFAKKWDWAPVLLGHLLSDNGIEIAGETETYHLERQYHYFEALCGPEISDDGSTIVGNYHLPNGSWADGGFIFRMYDMWGSYKVANSYVDTKDWLGKLCVACEPWVWCANADTYLYINEDCADTTSGWIYAPGINCMQLSVLSAGNSKFGWSHRLGRWFYVPEVTFLEECGWIYAL